MKGVLFLDPMFVRPGLKFLIVEENIVRVLFNFKPVHNIFLHMNSFSYNNHHWNQQSNCQFLFTQPLVFGNAGKLKHFHLEKLSTMEIGEKWNHYLELNGIATCINQFIFGNKFLSASFDSFASHCQREKWGKKSRIGINDFPHFGRSEQLRKYWSCN